LNFAPTSLFLISQFLQNTFNMSKKEHLTEEEIKTEDETLDPIMSLCKEVGLNFSAIYFEQIKKFFQAV